MCNFGSCKTRLPKSKCVWPMKINVICTVLAQFSHRIIGQHSTSHHSHSYVSNVFRLCSYYVIDCYIFTRMGLIYVYIHIFGHFAALYYFCLCALCSLYVLSICN